MHSGLAGTLGCLAGFTIARSLRQAIENFALFIITELIRKANILTDRDAPGKLTG